MKQLVLLILFLSAQCLAMAQPKRHFEIGGEAALPIVQKDFGPGFYVKYLAGKMQSSKITFSVGFSRFNNEHETNIQQQTTFLLPLLIGYRRYIQNIFLEPQVGFGAMYGVIKPEGDYSRPSVSAFFWRINAGYRFHRLVGGFCYQSANGIDSPGAGLWYNHTYNYTALYIGYNIF